MLGKRVFATVAVLALLTACEPRANSEKVALARSRTGGLMILICPPFGGVRSVVVRKPKAMSEPTRSRSEVYWTIRSRRPTSVTTIRYGSTPGGFTADSVAKPIPIGGVQVVVNGEFAEDANFRSIPIGRVAYGADHVSESEFRSQAGCP